VIEIVEDINHQKRIALLELDYFPASSTHCVASTRDPETQRVIPYGESRCSAYEVV
jgi:hypothetical protein